MGKNDLGGRRIAGLDAGRLSPIGTQPWNIILNRHTHGGMDSQPHSPMEKSERKPCLFGRRVHADTRAENIGRRYEMRLPSKKKMEAERVGPDGSIMPASCMARLGGKAS